MRYREVIAIVLVFCLSAAAQNSAADGLFQQAVERELGSGGTKDVAGAIRLYEQAVRQGHGPSMVRLGYLRQSGNGGPQDLPGAFALYRQAAETGDLEGQCMYALSYAQGVGTQKDPVTARKLLLSPATAGHQFAQYSLGIMIALGEGGPKGQAPARRWLDKAASGPDRGIAVRAADLRDKIDKDLFARDNSGTALVLGITAFFLLAGALSEGGGGGGSVGSSFPSSGFGHGGISAPAPRPTATPANGNITQTLHGADAIGLGRPVTMH